MATLEINHAYLTATALIKLKPVTLYDLLCFVKELALHKGLAEQTIIFKLQPIAKGLLQPDERTTLNAVCDLVRVGLFTAIGKNDLLGARGDDWVAKLTEHMDHDALAAFVLHTESELISTIF